MDEGIRSDKAISLAMPKAPIGNIQERPMRLSLGMPWMASLFHLQFIGMLLGAIFYSSHDMSFTWSILWHSFVLLDS
jgi:hypothetical protein